MRQRPLAQDCLRYQRNICYFAEKVVIKSPQNVGCRSTAECGRDGLVRREQNQVARRSFRQRAWKGAGVFAPLPFLDCLEERAREIGQKWKG